jgi:S1-C subfamily serine protease
MTSIDDSLPHDDLYTEPVDDGPTLLDDEDATGPVDAPLAPPDEPDAPAEEGPDDEPERAAPPPPVVRQSRAKKRSEWRKVERARRYAARKSVRFPIFTRSVLLWVFIFALVGVAFGTSGAFWWAHFNTEVAQLRDDTQDFEQREQGAAAAIDAQRNQALTQINDAIQPLSGLLDEANTVKLAETFNEKVWIVDTKDEAGLPAAGSAFAVVTDDKESLMVTSYAVIRASTVTPAPDIKVRRVSSTGTEEVKATLWTVDPAHDLALLSVPRGNIPLMDWAGDDTQAKAVGTRAFSISGWGGNGATIVPGLVTSTSSDGFRYSGPIGTDFRGGPIITSDGKILGIASLDYQPRGYNPGEIHDAVFVPIVCQGVLECGGGIKKKGDKNVTPAGPKPGPAPTPGAPVSIPGGGAAPD